MMIFYIILSVFCCFACIPERLQKFMFNGLNSDKISFFMINFIIWFVPWAMIPFPYNYKHVYIEFGFLLIICSILSCYISSKICAQNSVLQYFAEYETKIKDPLTLIALCIMLKYIDHNIVEIMLDTYNTYKFLGYYTIAELIIKIWIMVIGNTFLSVLFLQLYKALRSKLPL